MWNPSLTSATIASMIVSPGRARSTGQAVVTVTTSSSVVEFNPEEAKQIPTRTAVMNNNNAIEEKKRLFIFSIALKLKIIF
jgi:hypothetical protein